MMKSCRSRGCTNIPCATTSPGWVFAGSPYAFHTIGSTHGRKRGLIMPGSGAFPAARPGEDFYLLNKLAKVGSVQAAERGV